MTSLIQRFAVIRIESPIMVTKDGIFVIKEEFDSFDKAEEFLINQTHPEYFRIIQIWKML